MTAGLDQLRPLRVIYSPLHAVQSVIIHKIFIKKKFVRLDGPKFNTVKQKWQHSFSKTQAIFTSHLKFYSYSKALWPCVHRRYWTYLCCYTWDDRLQAASAMVHAAVFTCGACRLQTQTFPKMPFLLENCLSLWVLWWNSPQIGHCPLLWRRKDKNRKMMFWEQENQSCPFSDFFGTSYSSGLNSFGKPDLNWQMGLQVSSLGAGKAIT